MMRKKLVLEILLSALLLIGCSKPAAEHTTPAAPPTPRPELPFAQELQDVLDGWLEDQGGVGLSAAVIVPGYKTWIGVGGVSHEATPITPNTLFSAGSITKMYTAATTLQLAEQGLLTLDDPLQEWLADYPNIDNTITIRQLLNHTGGIYDMIKNPECWKAMLAEPARSWNTEEIVSSFVLKPYFDKGTDWHYSNTGYLLLHMIIEKATESKVSTEFRSRFWNPLALNNTFLAVEEELPENTAHGWLDVDADGALEDLSPFTSFFSGAGGSVFTTAGDLARWSQALFRERRVLNERSLNQMLTFHSPTAGDPFIAGYGFGVTRFSPDLTNGVEVWGHLGTGGGFGAACLYLPDYGVSIGIVANTDAGDAAMLTLKEFLKVTTSHLEPSS